MSRKPTYSSPKKMQDDIDKYFASFQGEKDKVPTVTGLTYYLGFSSRKNLINYEGKPEFAEIIKRAKLYIESVFENGMLTGKLNVTACIFNLKVNYGWREDDNLYGDVKIEITHNVRKTDAD